MSDRGGFVQIFDVSMQLRNKMPVYPGDPAPSVDNATYESVIFMGAHCGTHIDAPKHFIKNGKSLSDIPLENFIGNAFLIDLSNATRDAGAVTREMLENTDYARYDIALIKTRNSSDFMHKDHFENNFVAISQEAAEFLAQTGVKTVGFDCLTIDPLESETKPAHNILLSHGICVVEGLDFSEVPEGAYFAVCLPLKLHEADGAPARVVLITGVSK